ncbi:hypothetical protein AURDEDRAFT_171049 [Auricularia subglabra TFB-10046 SS5]|nr:hypothetical protein AURDEDRAFT_171049 [Auricularia subglabra TFB-10046 SS5]
MLTVGRQSGLVADNGGHDDGSGDGRRASIMDGGGNPGGDFSSGRTLLRYL